MIKRGTLPVGIEVEGDIWRDYELREQLVADEIEVLESEDAPRAMKSDSFFNVCIMARRLQFPGMHKDVAPAMILAMTSTDFSHIMATSQVLAAERASFRDAAQAAPDAAAGTPEDGV